MTSDLSLGDRPPGPTTSRRRLRYRLQQLRQQRGLSCEQVRRSMEWSLSKVTRIENGLVNLSASDLRNLLQFYQVDDPQDIAALCGLASQARQRHWSSGYRDLTSPAYRDMLGYQDDAALVTSYDPCVIPDLLQTTTYAAALAAGLHRWRSGGADARIRLSQARRKHFFGESGQQLHAFIDEVTLHREIGGPDTMRRQVEHLLQLTAQAGITVTVIPVAAGAHPGLPTAFTAFFLASDPPVVCLEANPEQAVLLDDPASATTYQQTIASMTQIGLHHDDARTSLLGHRARYRGGYPTR